MAAVVEEGLDSFAVVGYSMGVPLAIRAARRHPDRVRAPVLTAGFAAAGPRLRHAVRLWQGLLSHGDEALLGSLLTINGGGIAYLEGLSADEVDGIAAHWASTVPPGTPEHVDLAGRMDVRDDLAHVAVPTLVIVTTGDLLATPRWSARTRRGHPRRPAGRHRHRTPAVRRAAGAVVGADPRVPRRGASPLRRRCTRHRNGRGTTPWPPRGSARRSRACASRPSHRR